MDDNVALVTRVTHFFIGETHPNAPTIKANISIAFTLFSVICLATTSMVSMSKGFVGEWPYILPFLISLYANFLLGKSINASEMASGPPEIGIRLFAIASIFHFIAPIAAGVQTVARCSNDNANQVFITKNAGSAISGWAYSEELPTPCMTRSGNTNNFIYAGYIIISILQIMSNMIGMMACAASERILSRNTLKLVNRIVKLVPDTVKLKTVTAAILTQGQTLLPKADDSEKPAAEKIRRRNIVPADSQNSSGSKVTKNL